VIQKRLSEDLVLMKSGLFPASYKDSSKRYSVTLGVGGNVGDVRRRLEKLSVYLKKSKQCDLVKTGAILKNPPFGYLDQADFYNSVVLVKTNLQPQAFLKYILDVERRFGRKRSFPNAPRTLDIDMIFYENRKMNTPRLTLPHPHWFERESVVIPLGYVENR